jgi:hypothetical protein
MTWKMEAIMKAFEKMEKRQERRKEALARIEHTKKPASTSTKHIVFSLCGLHQPIAKLDFVATLLKYKSLHHN